MKRKDASEDQPYSSPYLIHQHEFGSNLGTGPAIGTVEVLLQQLASEFGFNPANTANYNNKFRNPVLSFSSGERLLILYSEKGLTGLRTQLQELREHGVI